MPSTVHFYYNVCRSCHAYLAPSGYNPTIKAAVATATALAIANACFTPVSVTSPTVTAAPGTSVWAGRLVDIELECIVQGMF
jgi:hypothetical protein